MKKDYTYIVLLNEESTSFVRGIQKKLSDKFGASEYQFQWPPHITVSFGNALDEKELEQVKNSLESIFRGQKAFQFDIEIISSKKKEVQEETFTSIRLKVKDNKELKSVSEKVTNIAQKHEIPFDAFSEDHFHLGLGRYKNIEIHENDLKSIIDLDKFPELTISNVAVFFSMVNEPKPEKALNVFQIDLI